MADYNTQLTDIYNQLGNIQSSLSKLALLSRVNTMQVSLQAQLNSFASRMTACEDQLNAMTLSMNDIITEMRHV